MIVCFNIQSCVSICMYVCVVCLCAFLVLFLSFFFGVCFLKREIKEVRQRVGQVGR